MEPEIRYARTSDGLNIAYYALGSGLTLIALPPTLGSPIKEEWDVSAIRSAVESSSRFLQYVRYDPRGVGLSDAHADTFTIDSLLRDLEAVADAVSPDKQIAIWGLAQLGPLAIAYAARHPERTAKLVLWSTGPVGADMLTDSIRRLAQLGNLDWELAMESVTQALLGLRGSPDVARDFAAMHRSISPAGRDAYLRFETDVLKWDVTDLLPDVRCPTLVMHPSGSRFYPVIERTADGGRHPGSPTPAHRHELDARHSRRAPDQRRVPPRPAADDGRAPSATSMVVVLFVDVVNSTGLTEEWGDAAFRERSAELDRTLRGAIERANGRVVEGKTLGDGVLATFLSANDALAAARHCAAAGNDAGLPLHLGLHAGDVIREARQRVRRRRERRSPRLRPLGTERDARVSHTVRDLARTSSNVTFEDRGEHELKGVSDAVRVFAASGGGGRESNPPDGDRPSQPL